MLSVGGLVRALGAEQSTEGQGRAGESLEGRTHGKGTAETIG